MKKFLCLFLAVLFTLTLVSCKKETLATPVNLQVDETGLVSWSSVQGATEYVVTINDSETHTVNTNIYQVEDITKNFTVFVIAKSNSKKLLDSNPSEKITFTAKTNQPIKPEPPVENIEIGIESASEVKSGKTIKLTATVKGTTDKSVTWDIIEGAEFATIDKDGNLTAKEVTGDKVIKVTATSNKDNKKVATKVITIVAKPTLTSEMLNTLNVDKISFEGYVNISLYTVGLFEKLDSTYVINIKTAMDGTNWYAEYENGQTGTTQNLYYKNDNGVASQVGVSFKNEEEYYPMLDNFENEISFEDSGLYNVLQNLKVSDFTFNEETWRYEFTGIDKGLPDKVLSASNPYDFDPKGFGLIIEDGEILGIYSMSNDDYGISQGYKAIQELYAFISLGDSVEVPTISKYSHEEIHDDLQIAIDNMASLTNYTLDFKENTVIYGTPSPSIIGFTESVCDNICHFRPYTMKLDGSVEYHKNASYGYSKISDTLYNTYFEQSDGTYEAVRAYQSSFEQAKPTFDFAAEIFREYYIDQENGTTTYYVDSVMSAVASTFYYGVGNDINLYGIFATESYTQEQFTPYVVVKDGYIIETGFYFYMGAIYGIVQINYSDFNETVLPADTEISFTTREVPTSWSQLSIVVTGDLEDTTADDYEVNALEYLKTYFDNENIEELMPFFGNPLGDTYGFGMTLIHISNSSNSAKKAIGFYYDVPLDINYSIESSLSAVEEYLKSLGFVENAFGEFKKGDIVVAPTDSDLDLMIYVWKA